MRGMQLCSAPSLGDGKWEQKERRSSLLKFKKRLAKHHNTGYRIVNNNFCLSNRGTEVNVLDYCITLLAERGYCILVLGLGWKWPGLWLATNLPQATPTHRCATNRPSCVAYPRSVDLLKSQWHGYGYWSCGWECWRGQLLSGDNIKSNNVGVDLPLNSRHSTRLLSYWAKRMWFNCGQAALSESQQAICYIYLAMRILTTQVLQKLSLHQRRQHKG